MIDDDLGNFTVGWIDGNRPQLVGVLLDHSYLAILTAEVKATIIRDGMLENSSDGVVEIDLCFKRVLIRVPN